jgi:hypothetical protein
LGAPVSSVESTLAGHVGSVDSNVFTGDIIGHIFRYDKSVSGMDRAGGAIMRNVSITSDYCKV